VAEPRRLHPAAGRRGERPAGAASWWSTRLEPVVDTRGRCACRCRERRRGLQTAGRPQHLGRRDPGRVPPGAMARRRAPGATWR